MTDLIPATDVKDGDIIYVHGYRCRVSNVMHYEHNLDVIAHDHRPVSRYTIHSKPSERNPARLPPCYEEMTSGGNASHMVHRE